MTIPFEVKYPASFLTFSLFVVFTTLFAYKMISNANMMVVRKKPELAKNWLSNS